MMGTALKHQLKIARDTMRMSEEGAEILGGMSKSEARELLRRHGSKKKKR